MSFQCRAEYRSNPALQGFRDRLNRIVAVSPFIGGWAIKGPATKIMTDMGIAITQNGLAGYHDGWIEYCTAERAMLNSLMFGHVMTTVLALLPIDRSTIVSRYQVLLARPAPIG
jgi:hypothetical protein